MKRRLCKTISWQIIGIIVIFLITGSWQESLMIPASGFVLYFLH